MFGCFFGHNWKKIGSAVGTANYESVLFNQRWTENTIVVLEQCEKCCEQRAYMENIDGTRTKMSVEFANRILGRID
jgi:hypothetical protein